MPPIPAEPVAPVVFIEEVVPALFAGVELDAREAAVEIKVGVMLTGDEGGEWTLHFVDGELGITRSREEACQITVIQQVSHWRSAIWEGRPPLVADAVTRVREGGADAMRPSPPEGSAAPDPLKGLSDLRGRIEIVIDAPTGAENEADDGRWAVGVQIGEGPVSSEPEATIRLGAPEAESIRQGTLHPLEALITGQLQLEGDLGLILQLQAVAMTLSMTAGTGHSR